MPKGTLSFNLNDSDEKMAFNRAVKSTDLAIALFELRYNLIRGLEYEFDGGKIQTPEDALERFRQKINELFEENNINIDDLIN